MNTPNVLWPVSLYADEIYEAKAGFEPALALLQRMGVRHTDLRVVNGYDHFMNLSEAKLDDLQALLRKYSVEVVALGTPLFKCPLRSAANPSWGAHHRANAGLHQEITFEYYLRQMPRAFALADRFGTENIRCFAFWREYNFNEVFEEIVEKLAEAARIAQAAGHRLYLENEHNTMAGTGVELARILRAVNSPALTGIYDDGNSGRIGGKPFPDDYAALRGLLGHVHVKFEKLDVMCGWPSLGRPGIGLKSGYQPYFMWQQPRAPFRSEIKYGDETFRFEGQRAFLTSANNLFYDHRAFFRALREDGYRGFITIDNSSFEGFERRLGRANIAELEADVQRTVEDLQASIREAWAS